MSFDASAFRRMVDELRSMVNGKNGKAIEFPILNVRFGMESWTYDDFEEFISELEPRAQKDSSLLVFGPSASPSLHVASRPVGTYPSTVTIKAFDRANVTRLGNVVDECARACYVPEPPKPAAVIAPKPKPKIFIGHGGSPQWRDLKDHLHEHHKYEVIAYETGQRAGHAIRDVVEQMLKQASFAVLVMTGEDEQPNGTVRARQNVIHELGLFQGRLGFTRAVVLLEDGTEEFSNIHGVQQIRFPKGAIRQTFGDVLAVLKREFET